MPMRSTPRPKEAKNNGKMPQLIPSLRNEIGEGFDDTEADDERDSERGRGDAELFGAEQRHDEFSFSPICTRPLRLGSSAASAMSGSGRRMAGIGSHYARCFKAVPAGYPPA